ncbi:hypothetical protein JW933_07695 [candidate division FCPU426 bacterium]|nr:hypothetical protein [candidate division FCPU426 bacterium]
MTKLRLFVILLAVISTGVILSLGGSRRNDCRVENQLVTFYSFPPVLRVGEAQLAFRIQDQDFRIITGRKTALSVIEAKTGAVKTVKLKPGPGRDVRGWVYFAAPGRYQAVASFADAQGRTLSARFPLRVRRGR